MVSLLTAVAILITLLVLIKPKINTESLNTGYISEFTQTINNTKSIKNIEHKYYTGSR